MEGDRAGGLFVFVSVAVGALGLFVVYRMLTAPSGDPGERLDFVPVPRTSQSVYTLEVDV